MISSQSRTPAWIMGIREVSGGKDPMMIEKMIMALTLVEELQLSGLDLIFKGGTAIKKIYVPDYRFSEDLDFTLLDIGKTNAELLTAGEELFPWLAREANLTLATRKVEEHASSNPTFYLNYRGPLQTDITSRFLKVDFHGTRPHPPRLPNGTHDPPDQAGFVLVRRD